MGRFEHNHIVPALDAGKIDGLYFLVMEFIDGYDLSQLLACCGPLSVAEACELTRQAALGLQHAAPDRLDTSRCKTIQLDADSRRSSQAIGPGTCSVNTTLPSDHGADCRWPSDGHLEVHGAEQFQDCRSVSAHCDVYSLGVTLYEFLRGSLPAKGLQIQGDSSDLKSYRDDVPNELANLVVAMTEVDPELRTQDAGEVADVLEKWTDGHDLPALFKKVRDRQGLNGQQLPASPDLRAGKLQPRRIPIHRGPQSKTGATLAAAAALLLLIPGTAWLANSLLSDDSSPAPVVSPDALLRIEISGEADNDDANKFTGMIVDESNGQIHNLQVGVNRLRPGTYTLDLEWESNVPEAFALVSGQDLTVYVQPPPNFHSDFHVLFPRIPSWSGAFARFHASVGPAQAPPDRLHNYDITLRVLNKELQADTETQWLEVVVENLDESHYRESAFILVDSHLYELEQARES